MKLNGLRYKCELEPINPGKYCNALCIIRSSLGQRKYCLIRQVISSNRFNSYEIFYDRTSKMWPLNTGDCLIEVTTRTGLTMCRFKLEFVQRRNKQHAFDIDNCVRLCETLLKMLMCWIPKWLIFAYNDVRLVFTSSCL